jgi:hypothetical protein
MTFPASALSFLPDGVESMGALLGVPRIASNPSVFIINQSYKIKTTLGPRGQRYFDHSSILAESAGFTMRMEAPGEQCSRGSNDSPPSSGCLG